MIIDEHGNWQREGTERDEIRLWLFDRCDTYEEFVFFDDLWDDLRDMCHFFDSSDTFVDRWYAEIGGLQ